MELNSPTSGPDRASELELLSKSVNPVRLKNNPVQIDEPTALELYRSIVEAD